MPKALEVRYVLPEALGGVGSCYDFGWDCFLLMIEKLRACYFIEPLDISGFTVQRVKLFKARSQLTEK